MPLLLRLLPAALAGAAVAVAFEPETVIVHWAVTSLPVFTMSATLDCLSVVASALSVTASTRLSYGA